MSQGEFGIPSRILIQPDGRGCPLHSDFRGFLHFPEGNPFVLVTGDVSSYPCKSRVQGFHHFKKLFFGYYQGWLNSENVPVDATQSGE